MYIEWDCYTTQFIICHVEYIHYTVEDFSFYGDLMHTFEPINDIRQTVTFDVDIVNDDRNEKVEEFVAVVYVTRIQSQFDRQDTPSILRLFTIVEILIDPNAPDSESIHHTCDQTYF